MMSIEQRSLLRSLLFQVADPLVLAAMYIISANLCDSLPGYSMAVVLAFIVATASHATFKNIRCYRTLQHGQLIDSVGGCLLGVTIIALGLFALGWIARIPEALGVPVIALWWSVSATTLIGMRILLRLRIFTIEPEEPVILAGEADRCLEMLKFLRQDPSHGLSIAGVVVDEIDQATQDEISELVPEVQGLQELPSLISTTQVQRVVICASLGNCNLIEGVMRQLSDLPITIQYCPDCSRLPIFCMDNATVAGRPAFDLSSSPLDERATVLKWIEDRVLGLLALVIFGPVMLLCAALVRLTSAGPALYIQERHGLGGKRIRVYKFRSMYTIPPNRSQAQRTERRASARFSAHIGGMMDAPGGMLQPSLVEAGGQSGWPPEPQLPPGRVMGRIARTLSTVSKIAPKGLTRKVSSIFIQAQRNDPRITPVGAILRKISLDELPQLLNVIKGDMSLVGPRPHAVKHNEQFRDRVNGLMRRHYVKPGITGLAQISGCRGETRTVTEMEQRLAYDLEYIRRWSLWLDLKILFVTAFKGFYNRQP